MAVCKIYKYGNDSASLHRLIKTHLVEISPSWEQREFDYSYMAFSMKKYISNK